MREPFWYVALATAALFYSSGAVLTRTQAQAGTAKKPNRVTRGTANFSRVLAQAARS